MKKKSIIPPDTLIEVVMKRGKEVREETMSYFKYNQIYWDLFAKGWRMTAYQKGFRK